MNYSVHITLKAVRDITEAAKYIKYTLLNPQAASALIDKAEKEMNTLSFMPQKHGIIDDPILGFRAIRFLSVGKYLIFYVIDEESKTVHVIRFLYGKRDWLRILREEPVDLD